MSSLKSAYRLPLCQSLPLLLLVVLNSSSLAQAKSESAFSALRSYHTTHQRQLKDLRLQLLDEVSRSLSKRTLERMKEFIERDSGVHFLFKGIETESLGLRVKGYRALRTEGLSLEQIKEVAAAIEENFIPPSAKNRALEEAIRESGPLLSGLLSLMDVALLKNDGRNLYHVHSREKILKSELKFLRASRTERIVKHIEATQKADQFRDYYFTLSDCFFTELDSFLMTGRISPLLHSLALTFSYRWTPYQHNIIVKLKDGTTLKGYTDTQKGTETPYFDLKWNKPSESSLELNPKGGVHIRLPKGVDPGWAKMEDKKTEFRFLSFSEIESITSEPGPSR